MEVNGQFPTLNAKPGGGGGQNRHQFNRRPDTQSPSRRLGDEKNLPVLGIEPRIVQPISAEGRIDTSQTSVDSCSRRLKKFEDLSSVVHCHRTYVSLY
jgi:hypothetical protein